MTPPVRVRIAAGAEELATLDGTLKAGRPECRRDALRHGLNYASSDHRMTSQDGRKLDSLSKKTRISTDVTGQAESMSCSREVISGF